ncbi:MAG: DEAD/DEAH box helicase family protein [Pseudomonadota bacterium]|nr:DEAD/DEAH box helicase family protein [Pseudomonadota bacterium]
MPLRPHQQKALDKMNTHRKGQVIVPTGGGKTMCMIEDAKRRFAQNSLPKTIVVVAPRILLANQLSSEFLEFITDVEVIHVHSGETHHKSTTKTDQLEYWYHNSTKNLLIFTTYHSLNKISASLDIEVDTIYYDEAHNSVQKNFYPPTEHFSHHANRCYYFTATPKHSRTPEKAGMNWSQTYGNVICQVPAPQLVNQGYILPPKVEVYRTRILEKDELVADRDCEQMIDAMDNLKKSKVLICAKSTSQIVNLIAHTKFVDELAWRGYSYMLITSKTGAIIDGEKVDREEFFNVLNAWGQDPDKRFVVLHHSILSEGINVKGLEAVLFMRSMDYVGISQTIGRVIRKGAKDKVFGLVCIPVYSKVGISTARKVEAVVDTIFNKGEAATSVITK